MAKKIYGVIKQLVLLLFLDIVLSKEHNNEVKALFRENPHFYRVNYKET
jgi:hypothetical protein